MVQVLKPGVAAEICRMPDGADDLNGLRGVVVSYNGSTGRYTFEIDDSDEIVSLKAKNLKEVASGAEEERGPNDASQATDADEQTSSDDASQPSEVLFQFNDLVKYRRPNGLESRARVTGLRYLDDEPIYTIRLLSNNVEKTTKAGSLTLLFRGEPARESRHQGPNLFQQVGKMIAEMNATTLIIILLAVLVLWPSGNTSHSGTPDYHPSYNGWWRSHWHWHWSWGWGWVGGLGSVIFVSFYARKLGTHNGRRNFSWNRLWQKLMEMDFWELVRLAAIIESALAFVAIAGRRRR